MMLGQAVGHDQRVHEVFMAALELPATERRAFVEGACGHDTAAAIEVHQLLALHDQLAIADLSESSDSDDVAGVQVGPYTIVRLLGAGGMGTVYLARRSDGLFHREVAIKVVRTSPIPAPDLRARFDAERRMLASLRHPGIALLLDAGQMADGRMYFVLEYVDGQPLTDHCTHHALGVTERVDLFLKVCDAVSYAHRSLIVHRDLKPSNILVNAEGQPKLLDFGIAKAVTQARVDPTPTVPGLRRGTPAYASPEHISGQPAHTAMDVFALGVILGELLVASRPSPTEAEVPTLVQTAPDPRRGSEQSTVDRAAGQALAPRATGDPELDAIVARALAPDWRNRYRSVDALAADLQAWRGHRPVSAYAGGRLYRMGKLVRRNVIATVAGLLAAVSVAATCVVLAVLWTGERRLRERTERQVEAAQRLADALLSANEKLSGVDGTTSVRRTLVATLSEYLTSVNLTHDAQVAVDTARAFRRLGDIEGNPNSSNIGDSAAALAHYDQALAILHGLERSASATSTDEARAETLAARADVHAARGDLDAAERDYTAARDLASSLLRSRPAEARYRKLLAGIYRPLGDVRMVRGEFAAARAEYERALALDTSLADESPADAEVVRLGALTHVRLGDVLAASGASAAAREHYDTAVGNLQSLAAGTAHRRPILRDAALGLARLGVLTARTNPSEGAETVERAIALLEGLRASDSGDSRARHDLFVTLVQYGDITPDASARQRALSQAQTLARRLAAEQPDDAARARDVAEVTARLRDEMPSPIVLDIMDGATDVPFQADGRAARAGDTLRARVGAAPAGWSRYLVVFGAHGPATVLQEPADPSHGWTVRVVGPTAQTVLLVATPRRLDQQTVDRFARSVEATAGPRVGGAESHVVWTDRMESIRTTATARGGAELHWVADVRRLLADLGPIRFAGRTFPVVSALY